MANYCRAVIKSPRGTATSTKLLTDFVCDVNTVYGNLKSENSQDYAGKPQRNCMFMNSASDYNRKYLFISYHIQP
jgi:hypothetical protein